MLLLRQYSDYFLFIRKFKSIVLIKIILEILDHLEFKASFNSLEPIMFFQDSCIPKVFKNFIISFSTL